jgi:hypothetical protein
MVPFFISTQIHNIPNSTLQAHEQIEHGVPYVYHLSFTQSFTADVSTEGADRKFSVLVCFQRIPYISASSSPIHIKTK